MKRVRSVGNPKNDVKRGFVICPYCGKRLYYEVKGVDDPRKHPGIIGRMKLHCAVKHAYDPKHPEDIPAEQWQVEELGGSF